MLRAKGKGLNTHLKGSLIKSNIGLFYFLTNFRIFFNVFYFLIGFDGFLVFIEFL